MAWVIDIFREASARYPATRILWPAVAIIGALSLLESFKVGWGVVALGAIFLLALLLLFFVIAAVERFLRDRATRSEILKWPSIVLVWSYTIGLCAALALSISCFFFSKPKTLPELFSFRDDLIVEERGRPTLAPPVTMPVSQQVPAIEQSTPGVLRAKSTNLDACLSAIDMSKSSPAQVERVARNCLEK